MLQITLSGRSLMYSWKSVRLTMEPLGTPTLTGYSYEDFLIQNHPNLHITEKRRNKTPVLTGYS